MLEGREGGRQERRKEECQGFDHHRAWLALKIGADHMAEMQGKVGKGCKAVADEPRCACGERRQSRPWGFTSCHVRTQGSSAHHCGPRQQAIQQWAPICATSARKSLGACACSCLHAVQCSTCGGHVRAIAPSVQAFSLQAVLGPVSPYM